MSCRCTLQCNTWQASKLGASSLLPSMCSLSSGADKYSMIALNMAKGACMLKTPELAVLTNSHNATLSMMYKHLCSRCRLVRMCETHTPLQQCAMYCVPLLMQHVLAVWTIATTPHSLLGSALSLLLVFRTNASYARLVEGRRVSNLTLYAHLIVP